MAVAVAIPFLAIRLVDYNFDLLAHCLIMRMSNRFALCAVA